MARIEWWNFGFQHVVNMGLCFVCRQQVEDGGFDVAYVDPLVERAYSDAAASATAGFPSPLP